MPMDPIRAVQFIPHVSPPAMFVPVADPSLSALLVNQIDYYFRYSHCSLLCIDHFNWLHESVFIALCGFFKM